MGIIDLHPANLTYREIHSRLISQGYSFRSWALSKGFNPRTVRATVSRWAGKKQQPFGRIARQILDELETTFDEAQR